MKKICLDAGHYGKMNVCPAIPEYYESECMWKLHLLLKKYLEKLGFEVVLARDGLAENKGLEARGKTSKGCDLFLSLHSNATGTYAMNEDVDYPMAYVALNGSASDIARKLVDCVESVIGTKQQGYITTRQYGDTPEESNLDYYGVIRGAVSVGTPALLLEHSFHTNERVVRWLLDDKNLDKLAAAEAQVIAEHFGIRAEYTPWTAKVINTEDLNVRSTPNGEIIKVIYSVTVIGEEPDSDGDIWYKVRLGDGTEGYIWPKYLSR